MVAVKSFARIHLANLINFGILPVTFEKASDYKAIAQGDVLDIPDIKKVVSGGDKLEVTNKSKKKKIVFNVNLNERQRKIILAGGLLNYTKKGGK